ncbi:peptidoglycan DD-metalloendopeptidase family protein [Gordonia amarae]|uniref:M23ase beta-sheet core domain-containing protein n=2 Tax=Gordonia amarae TaxID=36821 RepID=G7GQ15_9ACTN|nr:M23 family metallopeptidase [Gordonia amarae]MCS3878646.1 murein DD-endopeptidase MepM/ murein hydrolase activator NlpD [Gordonia amarae]QHN17238.1 peptidoglycan DD-metalloendopeptidase family protein [Gordonia amarae]QHN21764.1 peptidoglycan DD-metalloendopeptidase family protein [Gordonia amarae]QHN30615.1 peptidoglycan DD-metalloendopeptidase family protein [Gordonia amarae]QHN39392.1 peptidoglycan DD-metalloendopeptidase family protein [Gordonia amarae]
MTSADRPTPLRPFPIRVLALTLVGLAVAALTLSGAWVVGAAPPDGSPASAHRPPLPPVPTVVTAFEVGEHRWSQGHRGVDLSGPAGTAVVASAAGTVRHAGEVAGRPVVSILHPDGIITTYEPVTPTVRRGDHVARGQTVGTLEAGHESCPGMTCLHWGARRGAGHSADYLDPLGLLGAVRVRLKPL